MPDNKPNFVSRAVQKITQRTQPKPERVPHPFDIYLDPDAPAPPRDTVTVEHLTPEQMDRRAGREMTEAQRAGIAVEAELAARAALRRDVDSL